MFLSDSDVITLTGRRWRSKQVEALRRMGVPFRINAAGKPLTQAMLRNRFDDARDAAAEASPELAEQIRQCRKEAAPSLPPDVRVDIVKSTGRIRIEYRGMRLEIGVVE